MEHIQIFKRFGGDIDGWARMKKPESTMPSNIWSEIEGILQNLTIINNGLAAESFKEQTFKHIKSVSINDEVAEALLHLSNE